MPTFVNTDALDQLLLERYGGKVGWGLSVELERRRAFSVWMESLFAPVLTRRHDARVSFARTLGVEQSELISRLDTFATKKGKHDRTR
jgi:hypothetical protein